MNEQSVTYKMVFQFDDGGEKRYLIGNDFYPPALEKNNVVEIGEIPVTPRLKELDRFRHAPYTAEELIELLQAEIPEYAEVLSKQAGLLVAVGSAIQE